MASVASHTLAGRIDEAFVTMLVNQLVAPSEDWIEELAKSLSASVLSNRRR